MRVASTRRRSEEKRSKIRTRTRDGTGHGRSRETEHPLIRLQQRHGNRAVQRAVSDRSRTGLAAEVGDPDDAYEREADRVARRVARAPDNRFTGHEPSRDVAMSQTAASASRQRSGRRGTGEASPSATGSPGRPLDTATRDSMESKFGRDFSSVRVYTGDAAADLSQQLNARAFTVGSDVFFDRGEYRPRTASGERLLAHELTHVVQQRATGSPRRGGEPKKDSEASAAPSADTVASVRSPPSLGRGAPVVQRQARRRRRGRPPREGPPPVRPGRPVQGECELPTGVFHWSIVPGTRPEGVRFVDSGGFQRITSGGGCFNVQIVFYPEGLPERQRSTMRGLPREPDTRPVALVQTVRTYENYEAPSLGNLWNVFGSDPEAEVDALPSETEPFFGARRESPDEEWRDEPRASQRPTDDVACAGLPRADTGRGFGPSGSSFSRPGSYGAVLNDGPGVQKNGRKEFETAAVVLERGDPLGSLTWSIAHDGNEAVVGDVTCHGGTSQEFGEALDRFRTELAGGQ